MRSELEVPVELMTMTKRRVLEGLNLHLVPFLLLPLSLWLGCTGTRSLPVSLLGLLPG